MNRMELAERCEKATGPDMEIDAAIVHTVIAPDPDNYDWDNHKWLKYTASIDAAMTLVPEGCAINVVRTADGQSAHANLYRFDGNSECIPSAKFGGSATTPALALCAAALRAQAQSRSAVEGE